MTMMHISNIAAVYIGTIQVYILRRSLMALSEGFKGNNLTSHHGDTETEYDILCIRYTLDPQG